MIKNPVCKVRFAGFESTTLELTQAGWRVSAEQDSSYCTVRLALHHPEAGLYAVTDTITFMRYRGTMERASRETPETAMHMAKHGLLLTFTVVACSPEIRVCNMMMQTSYANWHAVDTFPSATASTYEERALHDFVPFATVDHNAHQIIVAPDSVPQVLDLLLKCQAPEAAARRHRAAKIHAQVLVS